MSNHQQQFSFEEKTNCCRDCAETKVCPFEKLEEQATQIKNLQRALQVLKYEFQKFHKGKNVEIDSLSFRVKIYKNELAKHKFLSEKQARGKVPNENFYKKELEEIKTCKICYSFYNENEKEPVKLDCKHVFCKACVIEIRRMVTVRPYPWMPIPHPTCPLCRADFENFYPVQI